MRAHFRVRSALVLLAAGIFVAACGEDTPLETTVDPVAMQADIDAAEAAFSAPAVESFVNLGVAIDDAMIGVGGASAVAYRAPLALLREGPRQPLDHMRARVRDVTDNSTAAAIPLAVLGKTFVWNLTTDEYQVDNALTGAPANGVRFRLYSLDSFGDVIEPVVFIGYVDISRTPNSGTVAVYTAAGVQVMEYTATVGGTANLPVFSIEGFVGAGVGQLTFDLTTGVSLVTGNITINWRTAVPGRGLSTRVQLAVGETASTIGAVMRNGLRKVEIGGTIHDATGGELTVKVGNRVFAIISLDEFGEGVITDENGDPLSAEDELTLWRIFEWFEGAFSVPDALLGPLFTILDIDF